MTITDESVDVTEDTSTGEENVSQNDSNSGRKREHDFTKHRDFHQELADYINNHPKYLEAGQTPILPGQVKAVLLLRTDHANTPERVAEREQRKAEVAQRNARYEGMSADQVAKAKAADKAADQAARFAAKAQEATERAQRLAAEASASGEDLAAVVAAQSESEGDEPEKRGRLGRRNR